MVFADILQSSCGKRPNRDEQLEFERKLEQPDGVLPRHQLFLVFGQVHGEPPILGLRDAVVRIVCDNVNPEPIRSEETTYQSSRGTARARSDQCRISVREC